jgi:hypothetical protein
MSYNIERDRECMQIMDRVLYGLYVRLSEDEMRTRAAVVERTRKTKAQRACKALKRS